MKMPTLLVILAEFTWAGEHLVSPITQPSASAFVLAFQLAQKASWLLGFLNELSSGFCGCVSLARKGYGET